MSQSNSEQKHSESPKAILDFLLQYAKCYLASGGPTSRLEDSLSKIGESYGKTTEVFATPTGVFVTISDPNDPIPHTALTRIKETGTNLGWLCSLEELELKLINREINLTTAHNSLSRLNLSAWQYPTWLLGLAAFLSGFVISFEAYQRFISAIISGAISAGVWLLGKQVILKFLKNPIFTDFISAVLILLLAAFAHIFISPLSIESYALGGIVMLVPGLALTTAIAELADQNLVSGTAKFMQGILALLSLGLAYLLFQQLSASFGFRQFMQPIALKTPVLWISAIALMVNVSCFGMIFRVPFYSLFFSTLTGFTGWLVVQFLSDSIAKAATPFLGAFVVGIVSLTFGRSFRLPSQVYSLPGIVAMLPGMLALKSFRYFASGDQDSGLDFGFQVAVTAVSIVFGLMSARIPFVLFSGIRNLKKWKS